MLGAARRLGVKSPTRRASSTLAGVCARVLRLPSPIDKAAVLGVKVEGATGRLSVESVAKVCEATPTGAMVGVDELDVAPARPKEPALIDKPVRRRGVPLPVFVLHSLAHIELNAIDIYAHTVAKWGPGGPLEAEGAAVPAEVWLELATVAQDEARHFLMLDSRLRQLGSRYGALHAHVALSTHAQETRDSLPDRLVSIPLVQEAHALDSGPRLQEKLCSAADPESADLVGRIVQEEQGHVAAGLRALRALCAADGSDPVEVFREAVQRCVPRGRLTGPFNHEAREAAGMGTEFYASLA